MSRSTRFPVAVHILAVLAVKSDGLCCSQIIAGSIATNAVVVRRILSQLAKADLFECQTGAHGGARLKANPKKVTLLDVYNAVEDAPLFRMHDPHPDCPVACCVREDLTALLTDGEAGFKTHLQNIPLSQLTDKAIAEYRN